MYISILCVWINDSKCKVNDNTKNFISVKSKHKIIINIITFAVVNVHHTLDTTQSL